MTKWNFVRDYHGRLTDLHLQLLRVLGQDPAPRGRAVHFVNDIARALSVSRTSVETALGDLITWGYVERVEPQTDGGVQS